MNAPQIIWIVLGAVHLTASIIKHGQPKDQRWNAGHSAVSIVIEAGLLYWGGFFA